MSAKLAPVLSLAIRLRDRGACVYCGRVIEGTDTVLTVDHLLPRVWWRPAQRALMNDPSNLAAACDPCNSLKGAMDVEAFAGMLDAHAIKLPAHLAHLRSVTGADVIDRVGVVIARPVDLNAAWLLLATMRRSR